ncbi:transcriptional regulator family: Grainyhead/CP2 [Penicillium hispanicum]|uniref:transcriptional regulator family: Grainyhead/CP2 n=1 Tax=Penicillium hispanicum TaxID=1080232 RepID=UPI00253F7828|nr:transcriptional regulator family: Grainyhead/CP2 [Penicillium hispanicum]KAJ5586826.1 transcriptional regulator family: Grainyhead/CP2 [Penicillium hispanicum]
MGAQKPDGELIARFQKLCGNAFFHRHAAESNVISTETSEENNKSAPSERITDHSQPIDDLYSFDGCAPSTPSMISSVLWLPPRSQDFPLYSSGSGATTTFHDQSGVSPRGSFQEDPQTVLPGHLTHQPQSQRDADDVGLMDPSQLWTSMDPFAPSEEDPSSKFARRDSGYGAMDESTNHLYLSEPLADLISQGAIKSTSPGSLTTGASTASSLAPEKYRFHTTLAAPTAMVSDSNEAPVSYLNKGQLYHIMVVDSTPPRTNTGPIHYRTSIRISFEQDEQRSDPAAYWQLWKNSRGWAESEKRDQKLAVEYAGQDHAHMQIEQVSLDGFRLNWTVSPDADVNRCSILVRFNFLSTDFTLSKGVKGASVRLCSKTEHLDPVDSARGPEICHCKVKLFRDHGAERKLSNDAMIIRKRIEKLELQAAQPTFLGQPKKRKRGSIAADRLNTSPQSQFRDNQQERIDHLRHILSSTRSESVLGLRGDIADDPDLYPTRLLDGENSEISDPVSRGRASTKTTNSLGSDSSGSGGSRLESVVNNGPLPASSQSDSRDRPDIPVACFFTMLKGNGPLSDQHYRAIYPRERTVHELLQRIADKYSITVATGCPIVYVNQAGLEVLVDDEFVREMTEGQDMVVEMDQVPSLDATTSLDTVQKIVLSY